MKLGTVKLSVEPLIRYESGKKQRRRIVQALRDEGRRAFLDGRSRQSNPHRYMDEYQWDRGWMDAYEERMRNGPTED